ncbi:dimethylamine monooxygenase subunit DmmA family protein [Pseudomonas cyclaminis]|uniref:dimethylamine monooxygenase subunit DmmA family protein n=1 Tax=Pseudomonas cyclaminis TaxID=2781239 RepID=UPI00244739E9|nr:dimethylamine monooxygenase subunit DmmA family protein [Pseudomonas cyclaminis]
MPALPAGRRSLYLACTRRGPRRGLEDHEIDMTCTTPGLRQVYCAHCGLTQAAGPAPLLNCIGCHVGLEVRTHFSRRLGAYLGVCINPDQPYAGFQP